MSGEFPILCKTCGKVLGGNIREEFFDRLSKEPTVKKLDPTMMEQIGPEFHHKSNVAVILDDLGVYRYCCRKVFTTWDQELLAATN